MPKLWSAVTPHAVSAPATQFKHGLESPLQVRGTSRLQPHVRGVVEPSAQGRNPSEGQTPAQHAFHGAAGTDVAQGMNSSEGQTPAQHAFTGAAGTDAAREVLQASRVYAAAVAKLEAALMQQGSNQAVSQVQALAIDGVQEEQANRDDVHAIAWQELDTISAQAAAISNTAELHEHETDQKAMHKPESWPNGNSAQAAGPVEPPANALHPAGNLDQSGTRSESQPGAAARYDQDADMAAVNDDGYISLETNQSSIEQRAALDAQRAKKSAATTSLFGAAESSDSQGSLPEIDSGDSSDSSSME